MANKGYDTFTIALSEPLAGGSRYVLRLDETVHTSSGAAIPPDNDSIVLFTFAAEQEPNDDNQTADILDGCAFGAIGSVDDTDCYQINDSSVTAIYLNSQGSQTTFIPGNAHDSSNSYREYKKNDTVALPEKVTFPLTVTVYAWQKSVGGYYEIGVQKKR